MLESPDAHTGTRDHLVPSLLLRVKNRENNLKWTSSSWQVVSSGMVSDWKAFDLFPDMSYKSDPPSVGGTMVKLLLLLLLHTCGPTTPALPCPGRPFTPSNVT